jgi:hypothetical protein
VGLIAPDNRSAVEAAPPPQPIRVIPGGPNAPELCMLSVEWDGLDAAVLAEQESGVPDVWLAQVKMDGINAIYIDGCIVGGREGAPLDCALQCQPGLARLEKALGEPYVFFGEYVAKDGFNATLSENRKRVGDGVFWIYDAVPFREWATGRDYATAIELRLTLLRDAFQQADTGAFVGFLNFWMLNAAEMRAKAHEVWAAGYEGLVKKRVGSPFVRRRSQDWHKVKQRFSAPCAVIDTIHKNGKLHRVIVRGPEPSGSKPITLAGGWSDAEAESIDIGMAEGSQGRIVKVEFELTVSTPRTVRAPKFKGLLA